MGVAVDDGLTIGVSTAKTGLATTAHDIGAAKLHSILENIFWNVLVLIILLSVPWT